jgi:hypothetical protein
MISNKRATVEAGLRKMWKEAGMICFGYCLSIWMEGLRKTVESLFRIGGLWGWDTKQIANHYNMTFDRTISDWSQNVMPYVVLHKWMKTSHRKFESSVGHGFMTPFFCVVLRPRPGNPTKYLNYWLFKMNSGSVYTSMRSTWTLKSKIEQQAYNSALISPLLESVRRWWKLQNEALHVSPNTVGLRNQEDEMGGECSTR